MSKQIIIPNVLVILDGWGLAKPSTRNAIHVANPVNFNRYYAEYAHAKLVNWGEAVGLPWGEMGNSEVGHMTIGSGKVTKQHSLNITHQITNREFFNNPNWKSILTNFTGSTIHVAGLISDAKVHSSFDHLIAVYEYLSHANYKVAFHLFTDGRDSGTHDSLSFFNKLPREIKNNLATISGRYYAMDRDSRWDRTKLVYDAMVLGKGPKFSSFKEVLEHNYSHGKTDEFIEPSIIGNYKGAETKDLFFIFNFREDRIRQISKALNNKNFSFFKRQMSTLKLATLTEFEDKELSKIKFLYPKIRVKDTLSDKLAEKNLTQLHIAESEKYAHVTYFFNGGREKKHKGENFMIVPSPRVVSYDLMPQMSAAEVCDDVIGNIGKYNFIVANFANPDMVAHTGDIEATSFAVKTVDIQLARIVNKVQALKGQVYITADHGNAEVLRHSYKKEVDTKHNRNKTPFIYIGEKKNTGITKMKGLADIAPFILKTIKL